LPQYFQQQRLGGPYLMIIVSVQNMFLPWHHSVANTSAENNSMVWVRERTIPTERPSLVREVIANFWGQRVPHGQRDGSLRPYSRFPRQEALLFYQVTQLYSRGWVDPVTSAYRIE
jgi:hypothetical protein